MRTTGLNDVLDRKSNSCTPMLKKSAAREGSQSLTAVCLYVVVTGEMFIRQAHFQVQEQIVIAEERHLLIFSWRHPPAHSWYRSEGSGATIHFKGDRKDQTALARLTSGHLKTLRFSSDDKKFNICTKCNMIEATPQHLLDCVALVYDDLLKRPDFVLEVMKANDLMDLI
ncbi:hypothetical protein AVEN_273942-1 [Araneus ventricosus]|uniref:Uncharacterized protein n=1 Tax=Araneus ventricosus TaxID=182803 RepID=A0A4Y2HN36_ARAVE|nr:hypothetical protein AVEN_273942-1 [Araneus ventricosus]